MTLEVETVVEMVVMRVDSNGETYGDEVIGDGGVDSISEVMEESSVTEMMVAVDIY